MKYVLIALLKAYRLVISPLYGNVCRYYPSCSAYALRAVEAHGAARGSWLAVRRLLRCHPWAAGGYDPVPDTYEGRAWVAEQAERARRSAAAGDTSADDTRADDAAVATEPAAHPGATPDHDPTSPGEVTPKARMTRY